MQRQLCTLSPDPVEECTAETDTASCNDLNPCTINDQCSNGVCVGQAVEFPMACDDGNSCTSGDVCAGSVCQGIDKEDGESCNDGLACTENDQCELGQCVGVEKTCGGLDSQCNFGICNEQTGECYAAPKPNGIACDDGNYCAQ